MKDKLRKLLKTAIVENINAKEKNVIQYETPDGENLLLRKDRLTHDQINLLNVFLTPIENEIYEENAEQKFWKALVNGDQVAVNNAPITAPFYQFIHFNINKDIQNKSDFEEALQNFFTNEITVVWRSNVEGFLVLYITEEDLNNSEEQENELDTIMEAIMADFFVKIIIFQGSRYTNLEEVPTIFSWEEHAFSIAKKYLPNASIIEKEQLIPYMLANEVSTATKQMLIKPIQLLHEDKELMKTIKVFLECNLNTTLAAKKLFMHRNSLQYRIDKFIEKTNIDIKQFQQAAALHFLIALLETNKKNLE